MAVYSNCNFKVFLNCCNVYEWIDGYLTCGNNCQTQEFSIYVYVYIMARQPLVGQGLLLVEVPRSYSDIPHIR
jgi:hypothetical protein